MCEKSTVLNINICMRNILMFQLLIMYEKAIAILTISFAWDIHCCLNHQFWIREKPGYLTINACTK